MLPDVYSDYLGDERSGAEVLGNKQAEDKTSWVFNMHQKWSMDCQQYYLGQQLALKMFVTGRIQ